MKISNTHRAILDRSGRIVSTQEIPQGDLLIQGNEATLYGFDQKMSFGHITGMSTGNQRYHLYIMVQVETQPGQFRLERWYVTFAPLEG